MKSLNLVLGLAVAMTMAACAKSDSGNSSPAAPGAKSSGNQNSTPQQQDAAVQPVAGKSHVLQITALNFLTGGSEPCNVKNKIFTFSDDDKAVETPICENSRIKVYATSNSGTVNFYATDILSGTELPASDYSTKQNFELGKTREMLRYGVQNPYGFTYVMAEEVTGIDPKLLEQWNELNDQATPLRAEILTAQQNGTKASPQTIKKLANIDLRLQVLAQKMQQGSKN